MKVDNKKIKIKSQNQEVKVGGTFSFASATRRRIKIKKGVRRKILGSRHSGIVGGAPLAMRLGPRVFFFFFSLHASLSFFFSFSCEVC
jgi:hypothetical protein